MIKASYGWPATVFWAWVIYYFWGSGKVDVDLIMGLVR